MKTKLPSGLLLLDKQADMTSFDCIRRLKKIWGRTDLGHGGTLDRFATGLLPIFTGEGLKLARFFLENFPSLPTYWKTYTGTFEMGSATETGDPEGAVIDIREARDLTMERIDLAMASLVGRPYDQIPPKYSAKKVGGERSSDLAREGKAPELKAVSVQLRDFRCTGLEGNLVRFEVTCSKGTYVRSLATDLARKLDTVAFVRDLRRTAVGNFEVAQALTLEQVEAMSAEKALLTMRAATSFVPPFSLITGELEQLRVGRTDLIAARLMNSGLAPGVYCAMDEGTVPQALFELDVEKRAKFLRSFIG